jgi:hypothetical protein
MVSGISGSGSFAPRFITNVRALPSTAPRVETPAAADASEASPEFASPSGDQDQLTHEFTMLDLASRHFARILPEIETVTAPVE